MQYMPTTARAVVDRAEVSTFLGSWWLLAYHEARKGASQNPGATPIIVACN